MIITMKIISKITLGLFFMLATLINLQAQSQTPPISFKIELRTDGYYYASFKSDRAFSAASNETQITSIQFTLVAPLGTFAPVSQTAATAGNITNFTDLLAVVPGSATPSWSSQRTAGPTPNTEYCFFAFPNVVKPTDIAIGVDYPLFKFRTTACLGDVRMYRNVADASGAADIRKPTLASENSININGFGSASLEAYKANYGTAATCPVQGAPDLSTTISGPTSSLINTPFDYTVTVKNTGDAASTGSVTQDIDIPAGLTFNSGGVSGWVCTPTGPVPGPTKISCTNPNPAIAANGGTSQFPVKVTPTTNGNLNVGGTVSGGGETNTVNNTTQSNSTNVGCGISAGTLTKI